MSSHALNVRPFAAGDAAAWDRFVEASPEGTFFHLAGWAGVIERSFGHRPHYLVAERAGEVVGVLPLVHLRTLMFGNALISTPFCVYGGALAADPAARAQLIEHACELARRLRVDYLELRDRERGELDWPTKDLYVTFRKPILPEEEANLLAIPRNQRAMVRKGIDAGLRAEVETDTRSFFGAYSESVHNLGTPVFGRGYFRDLSATFGERCEVLVVKKDERVVASVMSFYFRDEVLPYYGGGTSLARDVKGNDFMYWELMRRAWPRAACAARR